MGRRAGLVLMILLACGAVFGPPPPAGADPAGQTAGPSAAPSAAPQTAGAFLTSALTLAAFGLESARLAVARTDDEETRLLADGLIADFRRLGDDLATLATARHLTRDGMSSDGINAGRAAALAQLRLASDGEFTALWLSQQIDLHEEALGLFQAAADAPALDIRTRDLARDALPKLRENRTALAAAAVGTGAVATR